VFGKKGLRQYILPPTETFYVLIKKEKRNEEQKGRRKDRRQGMAEGEIDQFLP
jgi:hypothetical protein